jgi:hypothetical protein
LLKRVSLFTLAIVALLVPAMVVTAADNRIAAAKATVNEDRTLTVPVEITNQDGLMAIDLPLTWNEGVTLKQVSFENTRVDYFDLKIANINNVKRQVIIGLVTQISPEAKPMLKAGTGTIANLVFEVTDPNVTEVDVEAIKLTNPNHSPMFVYHAMKDGMGIHTKVDLNFERTSLSVSGEASSGLPTQFALGQNYPNPFNPTTEISFALPNAADVELSVYNLLGQKVTTLVNGAMPAGNHSVTWDGTSESGGSVASGIYFYRISAGSFNETKKMMMLK